MFKKIDEIIKLLRNIEKMLRYVVSYIAKQEKTEQTTIRKNTNG